MQRYDSTRVVADRSGLSRARIKALVASGELQPAAELWDGRRTVWLWPVGFTVARKKDSGPGRGGGGENSSP